MYRQPSVLLLYSQRGLLLYSTVLLYVDSTRICVHHHLNSSLRALQCHGMLDEVFDWCGASQFTTGHALMSHVVMGRSTPIDTTSSPKY
jgi:hypothetical protein